MKFLSAYCATSPPFINKNFSFSRSQLEVVEEKSVTPLLQNIKTLRAGSVLGLT